MCWVPLMSQPSSPLPLRSLATVLLAVILLNAHRQAHADGNFFDLANPGHLSPTLFASGYGSNKYGTTHGGFELEQSVTAMLEWWGARLHTRSIRVPASITQLAQLTGAAFAISDDSRVASLLL